MSADHSWRWNVGRWLLLWICLLAAVVRAHATDVLLVERPSALVVYNAYQQQVSDAERRLLTPFIPMQVIDPHVVMSDGFTVCMKVETHGAVFYLLTEGGVLAGKGYGASRLVRSVTLLGDTVHVLPGHSLGVEWPLGDGSARVSAGTPLVRYFRSGERTYVQSLSGNRFGWTMLRESERGSVWDRVRHIITAQTGIPERLVTGVREALNNANGTLKTLYAELNRESGRQLSAPSWHLDLTPERLTCLLQGASPNTFQRSTEQLARSLENLVLGSEYEVNVGEGRIEIRKK